MRIGLMAAAFVIGTSVSAFAASQTEHGARPASGSVQKVSRDSEECGAARRALKDAAAGRLPVRRVNRDLIREKEDAVRRLCGSLGEQAGAAGAMGEWSGGSGGPETAFAGPSGSAEGGGGGGGSGSGALSLSGGGSSGHGGVRRASVDAPVSFAKVGTDQGSSGSRPGDHRDGWGPNKPGGPGTPGRPPGRPDGTSPGTGPAVPGPIAGAGLPAVLAGLALWRLRRRFRLADKLADT
jgi:hypothetical protein